MHKISAIETSLAINFAGNGAISPTMPDSSSFLEKSPNVMDKSPNYLDKSPHIGEKMLMSPEAEMAGAGNGNGRSGNSGGIGGIGGKDAGDNNDDAGSLSDTNNSGIDEQV